MFIPRFFCPTREYCLVKLNCLPVLWQVRWTNFMIIARFFQSRVTLWSRKVWFRPVVVKTFHSHATILSRKIKLSSGVVTGTMDQFHDYRTIFPVARDSMFSWSLNLSIWHRSWWFQPGITKHRKRRWVVTDKFGVWNLSCFQKTAWIQGFMKVFRLKN